MKLRSPYFKTTEEALGAVGNLVLEDEDPYQDRQILANFYNGREIMTVKEGEEGNEPSLVNHLFGYNALNGFKLQLGAIYNSGDYIWQHKVVQKEIPVHMRGEMATVVSKAMDKAIKKSRRYKNQHRTMSGDLVLHGRSVFMFLDNFDWCPKVTHCYVPQKTEQLASAIPYAFVASDIPYHELESHLMKAKANPKTTKWKVGELEVMIKHLKEYGALTLTNQANQINEEHVQQVENQHEQMNSDMSTNMVLPVWYLYEVDHTNPKKPVSVKIITRYDVSEARHGQSEQAPTNALIFDHKNMYKRVEHWCHPVFMDTEIGGESTWQSVTGVGRLNYDRDADVEEFFNLAMEGAKDKMRTKWKALDGASREKLQKFFAERQDIIPEGVEAVEFKSDPGYQHAFQIIQVLRSLAKEDAGGATSNMGEKNDELEIQASERQQKSGFQIAARMDDVYEALDGLGREVFRRFTQNSLEKALPGYREIAQFRDELEEKGIDVRLFSQTTNDGSVQGVETITSRAAGDGSESGKKRSNQAMMGSLGAFNPEAQELIKRRWVRDETRDAEFAAEVVPFEYKPDPDQLARARNENTAALARGIVGFVPERAKDDLDPIHAGEHLSAMEAHLIKGRMKEYFDQVEAKGFEALATHAMVHIRFMQQGDVNAEQANEMFQKLQGMTREAEALQKQGEQKVERDKVDPIEMRKLDQKDRELDQADRQQTSLEQDRQTRSGIDARTAAVDEVTKIQKTAQDGAAVVNQTR